MTTRNALTLLETMVSVAILGTVLTVASQTLGTGTQLGADIKARSDTASSSSRLVQDLANDLRSADINKIYLSNTAWTQTVGAVSSFSFKICTGFDLTKTSPVLYNTGVVLTYDADAGTLTKTSTDLTTGKSWSALVANGLHKAGSFTSNDPGAGFSIIQMSPSSVDVVGNKLDIQAIFDRTLATGDKATSTVVSSIYLRSTMYANRGLVGGVTSSSTGSSSSGSGSTTTTTTPTTTTTTTPTTTTTTTPTTTTPTTTTPTVVVTNPIISLGSDQDTNSKKLQVLGTVTMPSGTTDTVKYSSFTVVTAPSGYTLYQGWNGQTSYGSGANKVAIGTNQFLILCAQSGGTVLTFSVGSTNGGTVTKSTTY